MIDTDSYIKSAFNLTRLDEGVMDENEWDIFNLLETHYKIDEDDLDDVFGELFGNEDLEADDLDDVYYSAFIMGIRIGINQERIRSDLNGD